MKKKAPKKKNIDTWRKIEIKLPAGFIKGLSAVRNSEGEALPLPEARGNAILNRMAYALNISEGLAHRVDSLTADLKKAFKIIEKLENKLKDEGVEYEEIKQEFEGKDTGNDHGKPGDNQDSESD